MTMLSPRRLRLMLELSRRGTIAAVADALQFTPSTVSEQLRVLEHEVGVPLLERGPRSVRLTSAAEALIREAEPILAGLSAARAEARAVAGLDRGSISLAAFPSAGATFVSHALGHVRTGRPELGLRVVDAEPTESLKLLVAGEVDVAVVYEYPYQKPNRQDGVVYRHLLDDPMLVCLPPEHPAVRHGSVKLAELQSEPFVAGRAGSPCFAFARAACARHGFEPEVAFETDDIGFTCALVNTGLAVALMPELLVLSAGVPVRALPARPPLDPRRLFAAYRDSARSFESVRALVEALVAAAAERSAERARAAA
jgi:DNA-binding transcriptional LysR family regulator